MRAWQGGGERAVGRRCRKKESEEDVVMQEKN